MDIQGAMWKKSSSSYNNALREASRKRSERNTLCALILVSRKWKISLCSNCCAFVPSIDFSNDSNDLPFIRRSGTTALLTLL